MGYYLRKTVLFFIFTMLFFSSPMFGQGSAKNVVNAKPEMVDTPPSSLPGKSDIEPLDPKAGQSGTTANPSIFNSFELVLSLAVLFFGLIVVAFEVHLARRGVISDEHVFKCIILTLVITGSIMLITAGYSNNQITPVVGILGSIAGYMLGKSVPNKDKSTGKLLKANSGNSQNDNEHGNK